MAREFGAMVEGDGLAPGGGQRAQQPGQGLGDRRGRLAWGPAGEQPARVAFMHRQHRLAGGAEQHQIGFPLPRGLAVRGGCGPFPPGVPVLEQGRRTALAAAPAPLPLGTGPVGPPGTALLRARGLGLAEAVDGLGGEDRPARVPPAPARDLLRRPALFEPGEHRGTPGGRAVEAGAAPAPGAGRLLSIGGAVALLAGGIALQLASNGRWRAIQTCSDLPARAPRGV